MRRLVVQNSVTLDGVMQAPARPDEDPRGGFDHGGWAAPYFDQVMMEDAGKGMAGEGAMLFGRVTYEDFASVWPNRPADDSFAAKLNRSPKYVVSRTLRPPLAWTGTTLLEGTRRRWFGHSRRRTGRISSSSAAASSSARSCRTA